MMALSCFNTVDQPLWVRPVWPVRVSSVDLVVAVWCSTRVAEAVCQSQMSWTRHLKWHGQTRTDLLRPPSKRRVAGSKPAGGAPLTRDFAVDDSWPVGSVCKKVLSCERARTHDLIRLCGYRDLTANVYKLTTSCAGGRTGYSLRQPAASPCAISTRPGRRSGWSALSM